MQIQCTEEEIAGVFEMTIDTLNARCKEMFKMTFSDIYKIHSQEGKKSLRRKQFEIALSGNPGMLIWLGKQYLNQKDRSEFKAEVSTEITDSIIKAFDTVDDEAVQS